MYRYLGPVVLLGHLNVLFSHTACIRSRKDVTTYSEEQNKSPILNVCVWHSQTRKQQSSLYLPLVI